jgi:hypothetical protein
VPVLQRRLHNPRIAVGEVVAARSAEARMEGPKMLSRDLVPIEEECAGWVLTSPTENSSPRVTQEM